MLRILKISALVSVVILLNAVTTLLFVQNAVPAIAGPQAGNCVTGDVNGDFIVDITDPIHLLGYIFEGTPEPVACAQVPSPVPAFRLVAAQPYQWGWPNAGAVNQTCIGLCPDYQLQFQEDELGSGLFDPLTSIITINESGLYQLGLQAEFSGNGYIDGMLSIRVNGLSVSESNYTDNGWSSSSRGKGVVSDLHRLEVGDQIEYHTLVSVQTPGALSTLVTSGLRTSAFGIKVAP